MQQKLSARDFHRPPLGVSQVWELDQEGRAAAFVRRLVLVSEIKRRPREGLDVIQQSLARSSSLLFITRLYG